MLWAVSRAPFEKLEAYRRRMAWTFPCASSHGSDFNADFNVWISEDEQRAGGTEYNYRPEAVWRDRPDTDGSDAIFARMTGTDTETCVRERPGMSAFALEDGGVYHIYSAYERGLDGL